ncbi:wall-associated receptor kinase 5-like [Rhododendron vialii]|uniref:wall-associated receptor kinase 5-like n=1 Tax=Rhododendron vialii TaxID=182163 RepID=UPI00265E4E28|nr:wall-associated receptor kinase 5-like [Rhododendron vialii]
MVLSCDDFGQLLGSSQVGSLSSGCGSICSNSMDMTDLKCPGIGCCQIIVPKGLKSYNVSLKSFENRTQIMSNGKCGYAFVGEQDGFHFPSLSDFSDPNFRNRIPIVLDYAIGNQSCAVVNNSNAYLCQQNTLCIDNMESGLGGTITK